MMGACVGLIVDIHESIIHELHCAWISVVSPRPSVKDGGAPRKGLELTRLHACVSNSQLHLFALAPYISAIALAGFRRIIEIHGALPSDLSLEQGEGG